HVGHDIKVHGIFPSLRWFSGKSGFIREDRGRRDLLTCAGRRLRRVFSSGGSAFASVPGRRSGGRFAGVGLWWTLSPPRRFPPAGRRSTAAGSGGRCES